MRVRVLGSGAGGGFPQWNCNCDNCRRLRSGELRGRARTQSSIAIQGDPPAWVLVNASPDLRQQIEAFPELQPGRARRDTAISAVIVVDAQIDHSTGLMTLREHTEALRVHCTREVHEDLTSGYPLLSVLEHYCGVAWSEIPLDGRAFAVPGASALAFTALPIESEAPPYSPRRHAPAPGDTIGLRIEEQGSARTLVYAPGLGRWEPRVARAMAEADCVLVDGTLWTDDELARAGVGAKTGSEMGHLQQSGEEGILHRLQALERPRKILIHVNNTNPLLDEDSAEHAALRAAGIELAFDGMEIVL